MNTKTWFNLTGEFLIEMPCLKLSVPCAPLFLQ